jgi:Na+/H+ antiporter NhaD/arsenite permease-like protein/S1-C subfamily serine protease
MDKRELKSWAVIIVAFLMIMGVWVFIKKPNLFKRIDPKSRYINFETAAESVQPGIVKINNFGYGIIIHPRGYVLTVDPLKSQKNLASVAGTKVEPAGLYLTTYTGESFNAETIKIDKKTGLALLKIMVNQEFMPVRSASSDKVKPGELLFVSTDKELVVSKVEKLNQTKKELIQIDMIPNLAVNGLPLFNKDGKLVGICTTLSETQYNNNPKVYAISISRAKSLLTTMSKIIPETVYTKKKTARIKWLGARFLPQSEITGVSLLVEKISQSQSAGNIWRLGGVKRGDKIVKINNNRITGLIELEKALPLLAQSKKANLTIVRDSKERELTIRLRRNFWSKKLSFLPVVSILMVFFLIYYFVYHNRIDRTILFVLGAILITVLGYYLDFYDLESGWEALRSKIDVIYFIVGMSILTIVLNEGGLFDYLAKKIVLITKGNKWKIMLSFCLLTYVCSLFVNNLVTIMVLIPMIFSLSRYLNFDPKSYIIGMIIASNLGGASTMVGDFPNMLIGTEAGIAFIKFISYMMPVCLIELFILMIYIQATQKGLFLKREKKSGLNVYKELPQLGGKKSSPKSDKENLFYRIEQRLRAGLRDPEIVKRGLIILGVIVIGFFVSDFIRISPAIIALIGGLAALFFCKVKIETILERLNYKDIFFFSGLFILVGAAEASGLLNLFGETIVHLSFGNVLIRCLLLMWLAAGITAFLNAGPATALFLPLVLSFGMSAPHYLYFWALSLGVLAGSSATLTGATAGSVSSNMLDEFLNMQKVKKVNGLKDKSLPFTSALSFREYSRIGIPVALIFLVVSSVYITLIYRW